MFERSLTKTKSGPTTIRETSIKIQAGELDRLLQNALLYADEKALRLQEILFLFSEDTLQVLACDDYVAVIDSGDITEGSEMELVFSISDIKKIAEWVKSDKKIIHKYDIILRRKFTGMIFECDETSTDEDSDNLFIKDETPSEGWEVVLLILSDNLDVVEMDEFIIKPERLSKLWRLKSDKDAPIHLRGVEVNNMLLIQFKKGETLHGVIMPVQREFVKEEFLWAHDAPEGLTGG